MSEQEIRNQKAALFLERDDARVQVAHLREKATRIGRAFQAFGRDIEFSAERVINTTDSHTLGETDLTTYHPAEVQMIQVTEAFRVADELRAALQAVRDLEIRAKAVGVQ